MVDLEAVIQGFSLKKLFYIYFGNSRGVAPFLVELQVLCLLFYWVWGPSWVFLKYFIYLLCKVLFFGELPLVTAS